MPVFSQLRQRTQGVWNGYYSMGSIWQRSRFIKSAKGRLTFVLISKIYRQMYADTGIAAGHVGSRVDHEPRAVSCSR